MIDEKVEQRRIKIFIRDGLEEELARELARGLSLRRKDDDRRLCYECGNFDGKCREDAAYPWNKFETLKFQLQRCPQFKEKKNVE